jgi:hypothetical protein
MNILDTIINAQNGAAVRQLGSQVGLREDQTASALSALVPALAAGFQRNLQSEGGVGDLVAALSAGNHAQYINDPSMLGNSATIADGNGILGHVFGSKEVSREVASRAAAQTGLNTEVMKRLLPLAATMMMGAFAQKAGRGASPAFASSGGGFAEMLTPMLDSNRDGSIVDDVSGLIGRFVGRASR